MAKAQHNLTLQTVTQSCKFTDWPPWHCCFIIIIIALSFPQAHWYWCTASNHSRALSPLRATTTEHLSFSVYLTQCMSLNGPKPEKRDRGIHAEMTPLTVNTSEYLTWNAKGKRRFFSLYFACCQGWSMDSSPAVVLQRMFVNPAWFLYFLPVVYWIN